MPLNSVFEMSGHVWIFGKWSIIIAINWHRQIFRCAICFTQWTFLRVHRQSGIYALSQSIDIWQIVTQLAIAIRCRPNGRQLQSLSSGSRQHVLHFQQLSGNTCAVSLSSLSILFPVASSITASIHRLVAVSLYWRSTVRVVIVVRIVLSTIDAHLFCLLSSACYCKSISTVNSKRHQTSMWMTLFMWLKI
jgi:hypothetical protein